MVEKRRYDVNIDGYRIKNLACWLRADLNKAQRRRYINSQKRAKDQSLNE